MPELAEVAYACSKWNPGINKKIVGVIIQPDSRVYRKFDSKKYEECSLRAAWNFTCIFDSIFKFIKQDSSKVDSLVKSLLTKREKVRNNKDWIQSDYLREEILKLGWIVEDTEEGQKIRKK